MMATAPELDAERMKAAPMDLEKLINERPAPVAASLPRSPFGPASAGGASVKVPNVMGQPARATVPAATSAEVVRQMLESVKGLKVDVILTTPSGEKWVVINGANYREGDAVAGMEIVEIQGTRVKLQQAGVTCLLRME
jgi:hypothetical protein